MNNFKNTRDRKKKVMKILLLKNNLISIIRNKLSKIESFYFQETKK